MVYHAVRVDEIDLRFTVGYHDHDHDHVSISGEGRNKTLRDSLSGITSVLALLNSSRVYGGRRISVQIKVQEVVWRTGVLFEYCGHAGRALPFPSFGSSDDVNDTQ